LYLTSWNILNGMRKKRQQLGNSTRWVVKIGSALITSEHQGLNREAIRDWGQQIARLHGRGKKIILVSSGAVAEGMSRLGWKKRPHALYELQAAAATGQMGLVQAYESNFQSHGLHSAQVLLTHDDLRDRRRYLNARSTLCTLLRLGVIPVVNENDTVAIDEIRFGDNDSLAALVANLVEAHLLVILTDQRGLYDRNPEKYSDARLIEFAHAEDSSLNQAAGPSANELSRGGMVTKVSAGRRASRSGTATFIACGREPAVLERIAQGEQTGTLLLPTDEPLAARKRWIANQLMVRGTLTLDAGAAQVIRQSGRSLLAVGVTHVTGKFRRGDMVMCLDLEGREVGRGLTNYDANETARIKGRPSCDIEHILGYVDEPELIHRDNLVLT
jgi:glutamate 5-kinase